MSLLTYAMDGARLLFMWTMYPKVSNVVASALIVEQNSTQRMAVPYASTTLLTNTVLNVKELTNHQCIVSQRRSCKAQGA